MGAAATSGPAVATALGLTASQATSRTPFDADGRAKTSLTRDRMTIDVHFELNRALNAGSAATLNCLLPQRHLQRRGDRRGVLDAGYVPPDDGSRRHLKPHTGAEGRLNRWVAWSARHQ
jgi:hypothetical protein